MTVQEFIEAYNRAPQKEMFFERHIKTDYVSYFLKIAEAHKIVEFSMYKEVNGKRVFWKDSTTLFQLFISRLLNYYTDIDLGTDSATGFDELNKYGLINLIVSKIPESEYSEWQTILNMVSEDELENNRSFAGYIDTKLEALSILGNSLMEMGDEEIKKAAIDAANKVVQINQEG